MPVAGAWGESVTDPADTNGLDDLGSRIRAARERHEPEPRAVAASALARGTRYAAEIAVATVVGGGVGWFIDRQFGTAPWAALLFLLLGLAAGFRNLLRAVEREAAAIAEQDAAAGSRDGSQSAGTSGGKG
jgi:ATP synthase protein I